MAGKVVIGGASHFGEVRKRVFSEARQRAPEEAVASLIPVGRREMCFIARSSAVLLGGLILLVATASSSLAQKRTPLQTIDFPPGYETVAVIAELEPGQCTTRHGHPGIESAYVLEGEAVAKFDNKPDQILKTGQPLQFGVEEVHNVCNVSSAPFRALAHYIVQKGKPLVTRAP